MTQKLKFFLVSALAETIGTPLLFPGKAAERFNPLYFQLELFHSYSETRSCGWMISEKATDDTISKHTGIPHFDT